MNIAIESPVKTLLNILKAVSVSMQEASVRITKEGISFRGMGPSHIDLIDVNFVAADFKKFEVDENVKFGFKVDDILSIVKRFGDGKKAEQTVELKITPEGEVLFGSIKKSFNTRVIEAEEGSGKLPEVAFTSKFSVSTSELSDALEDVALQAERVRITIKDGKVDLSGKGDKGSATIQLTTAKDVTGDSATVYSLDLFQKVVDAIDEESATIESGENKPVRLTMGKIVYYLAPQVAQ